MSGIILAFAFAGDAERLAGVAAVKHVDSRGGLVDLPHVGHDRNSGPVPLEDRSAMGVGFAHPSRLSAKGNMDGKVEATDPGEQGSGAHVTTTP